MTPDGVNEVVREGLLVAGMIGGPLLGAGIAMGLVVGVVQAATQIQETSLSFVPKLVALLVTLAVIGPWALDKLSTYMVSQIESIGSTHGEER